jgi:cystathionine beta-lyase
MTDFDQLIDRTGSASVKFDARQAVFGQSDVTPLWVADMDFATPTAVTDALIKRAQHPILGYTLHPKSIFNAVQHWFLKRHDWAIAKKEILFCPGVVPSMHAAILALSNKGDKVIVQPPVYPPFFTAVTETERELVVNPLILKDNRYQIDFAHLEQCAADGAKLLLLCSPHNPVGRVWTESELTRILKIARKYQLIIISDEIHADLVFPEFTHIPLARLADDVTVITAVSASKTFNIPGLGLSCLVVNNDEHRKAIQKVFDQWHSSACNPFSIVAFEAAYQYCEPWLDELLIYLNETRQSVIAFFNQSLPEIKVIDSEGTYLLWLDCRGLALSDHDLKQFFIKQAGLGLNSGVSFGEAGSGFMRLNIAAPRAVIMAACEQLKRAWSQYNK